MTQDQENTNNSFKFSSKIVGVSFEGRQDYIKQYVKPGDKLELIAEPDNKFDVNAVMVVHNGTQVGYISKETAAKISKDKCTAKVIEITGLEFDNIGCNIEVSVERENGDTK